MLIIILFILKIIYLNYLKAISQIKLPFWDLHWYYVAKKSKTISNILAFLVMVVMKFLAVIHLDMKNFFH